MTRKYECIGVLPLAFAKPHRQEVETGEFFERDFEATSGLEHEAFLINCGLIRRVSTVVTPEKIQEAVKTQEERTRKTKTTEDGHGGRSAN